MEEELLKLEQLEEQEILSADQLSVKTQLITELLKMGEEEEVYWEQRSHERNLKEGDSNTDYFHRLANGRRRKNLIISMVDGDRIIEGDAELLNHATNYYRHLFGPALGITLPLDYNLWTQEEKVSEEQNILLTKPSSEEEIRFAPFSIEKNKAAGLDKISIEFYQACWDIIRADILELFDDFHKGALDVSRLNYGIITLLPKVHDDSKLQQFRPICLLNCLY